ncbi:single-stranded DNA-binding protein [Clostridium botulinum]|uniref:single-stranded DNA-binding protein n=1 Tax=Clostridium botulinum TaxID=1491 RepID=UPI00174A359B|nr:single-stranded DNA-binding protein [Clostridium botulinum]MBD5637146.1 single-stranded DNA-binding protein [Clostridium botulinum]
MSTVNQLLEIAKSEIKDLKSGEIFLVRDQFKGYEWNRIPRSERLLLGTLFINFVKNTDININIIEKTSYGQQKYSHRILHEVSETQPEGNYLI